MSSQIRVRLKPRHVLQLTVHLVGGGVDDTHGCAYGNDEDDDRNDHHRISDRFVLRPLLFDVPEAPDDTHRRKEDGS